MKTLLGWLVLSVVGFGVFSLLGWLWDNTIAAMKASPTPAQLACPKPSQAGPFHSRSEHGGVSF